MLSLLHLNAIGTLAGPAPYRSQRRLRVASVRFHLDWVRDLQMGHDVLILAILMPVGFELDTAVGGLQRIRDHLWRDSAVAELARGNADYSHTDAVVGDSLSRPPTMVST